MNFMDKSVAAGSAGSGGGCVRVVSESGGIRRCVAEWAGHEMDFFSFGSGRRPLVMIPGVSMFPIIGSAELVAAAYSVFSPSHSVYLFDRKRRMGDGYSVKDMAEDTARAMALAGIRDADVFGASQGGMIAQCIAAFHPELVRSVCLCSTLVRQNHVSSETFGAWVRLASAGDVAALNRDVVAKVYSPEYRMKNAEALEASYGIGGAEEMRRFRILSDACLKFDFSDGLNRIECPVFAVGAERDDVLSVEGTREIASALGCESYVYEGYGHAVYDEAPDFIGRMAGFFAKV